MKLSFCIPTYNHAAYLGAALDSILSQATGDFEIVIVDGCSTDDTADVVAAYQRRTDVIAYRRMPQNRGIDPDIAEVVGMATGDYCWLMSSDDVLAEGAVAAVRTAITGGRDLYLGARMICTESLRIFGRDDVFDPPRSRSWNFSNRVELLNYLEHAVGLIALFSYISVLVVRRQTWERGGENPQYHGSCYAHAYRLWGALRDDGTVEYLENPLVLCRMDTDHFASRGVFRRFLLDFDGYLRMADDVFGAEPALRAAFLAAVRREHNTMRLAKFYHACQDGEQRRRAVTRLESLGYSRLQLLAMKCIARTGPLLQLAVTARRAVRRALPRS